MKTFSAKPTDVKREWHLIDASGITLGRLSTVVSSLLLGKHKPSFTKHIDCGDYVVITNAAEIKITGAKETDKVYYRHTGYPGGIKSRTLGELKAFDVTKPIEKAVRGMLPVNKLRTDRLKRLKVYAGNEHQNSAQKPKPYIIKGTK
jgi:large subunit ribosomal protein L13